MTNTQIDYSTIEAEEPHIAELRAIVMPSIGDRPWQGITSRLFQFYAANSGADFFLEQDLPSSADLPIPALRDKPGRANKAAYAIKTYFAWYYIEERGYDRVLVVDDTTLVSPDAPNIFDWGRAGMVAAKPTGKDHAEMSFAAIAAWLLFNRIADSKQIGDKVSNIAGILVNAADRFARAFQMLEKYLPDGAKHRILLPLFRSVLSFDRESYVNSGVMLYDRNVVSAIHRDRIIKNAPLLFSSYPHQTLTYFLLTSAGVAINPLPSFFNWKPGDPMPRSRRSRLRRLEDPLEDGVFIYHVTGAYKYRQDLIVQIGRMLLQAWDKGASKNDCC